MEKNVKLRLNIGGKLFVTREETVRNFPDTKLSNLSTSSKEYESDTGEYYFDRDPELFRPILNLYRNKELHLPKHICGKSLRKELEYWEISEELISGCCWKVMYKVDQDDILSNDIVNVKDSNDLLLSTDEIQSPLKRFRYALWMFLSNPNSSFVAKAWNNVYLVMVLISVGILINQSNPDVRVHRQYNSTTFSNMANITNKKLLLLHKTDLHPAMAYLDIICDIMFTIELTLHFLTAPNKLMFIKNSLNIIDAIVIFCTWSTLTIEHIYRNELLDEHAALTNVYGVLKYISVLRILRFFKLAERFHSLKIMILSMKKCFGELVMMFMCVNVIATLFGCALYIAEFDNDNIPDTYIAIWWAIVTMTTVGYGDYIPRSHAGRFVGTLCAITGLLVLSMPIAIIATNFNVYHAKNDYGDIQMKYKNSKIKKRESTINWQTNKKQKTARL